MFKYLLIFFISFIFIGCAVKTPYASSKAYHVVIKNLKFAVSDTGFLKKDDKRLNLQLFSASTPILDILIKEDICLNFLCMEKEAFNYEFFGTKHYETFIEELFNLQPIYKQINMQSKENGFEQRIKTNFYDITYKVQGNNLYFKDTKNNILIKFKELQ